MPKASIDKSEGHGDSKFAEMSFLDFLDSKGKEDKDTRTVESKPFNKHTCKNMRSCCKGQLREAYR